MLLFLFLLLLLLNVFHYDISAYYLFFRFFFCCVEKTIPKLKKSHTILKQYIYIGKYG
jgi:hypothetical protein